MTNTVQYGLSNVFYSTITKDTNNTYTYGTPAPILGAVSLSLDPAGESYNFMADNGIFFSKNANNGYTGTLSIAKLPDQFRIDVLGEKLLAGGLLETSDAKTKDVALMFQVEGDVHSDKFIYYDVTIARPSQAANTTGESMEVTAQELTFTAKPRLNDKATRYVTGAETPKQVFDEFFDVVQTPEILELAGTL